MPEQSTAIIPASLESALSRTVEVAARKLERTCENWPAGLAAPVYTVDGRWYRAKNLWTDWTPGFLAGQLWILAGLLGDGGWRSRAEEYSRALRARRFDRDVHDLGFIFLSSYGRWWEALAADDPLREHVEDILVTAGTVQSFRWNGIGEDGFIYSFNGPQSLFVDVMMNVRLLFWGARHGAEEEVERRALEHCRTSAKYLVRRDGDALGDVDGSTVHEAIFNTDPGRGEFRCLSTQQGYSPFTCWSRGLGWAMYGFCEAFRYTGEREFLETAKLCAGYYLSQTPEHGVPYWDYGAPDIPDEPVDSSAAAVIGCALWMLADHVDGATARAYREGTLRIATTLTGPEFLSPARDPHEGILLQGVYHRPRGWGVNASLMWGEYFFMELVERLLGAAGAR